MGALKRVALLSGSVYISSSDVMMPRMLAEWAVRGLVPNLLVGDQAAIMVYLSRQTSEEEEEESELRLRLRQRGVVKRE